MNGSLKRLLTFLMAVSMMISMLPLSVSAAEVTETAPEETVTTQQTEQPVQETEPVSEQIQAAPQQQEAVPETTVCVQDEAPAPLTDAGITVTVEPISIEEGTNGNWWYDYNEQTQQHDLQYYSYDWENFVYYTVNFPDGGSYSSSYLEGFTYNGDWYSVFYTDDQSYANQWTGGNTYNIPATIAGQEVVIPVTITESALQSLTIAPVSAVEGTNGYVATNYNEQTGEYDLEYYYYSFWNFEFTATFSDGTVITDTGSGFDYNGQWYGFSMYSNQSYKNQWTAGNTYYYSVSVMGTTVQVPVTIERSPLESFTIAPVSVIEGTYGYMNSYWDEEGNEHQYYHYSSWNLLNKTTYTATLTDGTVLTGSGYGLEYNGEWYNFETDSDQGSEAQWTAGNTYTMTVTVMGKTCQVPVTVEESPLESITFTPITVVEKTNGVLDSYVDEEGNIVEYYRYWEDDLLELSTYTATFSDGTVVTESDSALYYDGVWYSFDNDSDQLDNGPWTVGNTYSITVTIMGQTVQVPVTVTASPLVSLTFTPTSVIKGTCGYMSSYWDDQGNEGEYYYYSEWQILDETTFTATFSDGTVITDNGYERGFEYGGVWYAFEYGSNQSYENQWTGGNTYSVTVSVMGLEAQIPVTITESPLVSLTFAPISVVEGTHGYTNRYYNEQTGEYDLEYYEYDIWQLLHTTTYTATFSDGTVVTDSSTSLPYNGVYYSFDYSDDQSYYEPWEGGNTYTFTVTVLGKTVEVPVTICEINETDGYSYILQNGMAIITGCTLESEELNIPATLDGNPVVGITSLGDALYTARKITIPDSVTMLSEEAFVPEYWYEIVAMWELHLGSGVSQFNVDMICDAVYLTRITVSEDNAYFCSVDGVLYNKDCTVMVAYPPRKQETHIIPDSVENVDILFDYAQLYGGISYQMGAGVKGYKMVDGILYDEEMTKVLSCTSEATGVYVMPESVRWISAHAFENSNLTEVTISSNVTDIVYAAFAGSESLTKVTIPEGVKTIDGYAFSGCSSLESADIPKTVDYFGEHAYTGCSALKAVNINDLTAWCRTTFDGSAANPLTIAEDLYLNGQRVIDLEIPESDVLSSVYPYAFYNGSMTSVSVPSTVYSIGHQTFYGSSVESLQLEEGIENIGTSAFAESELKSVVLPDSLTDLGSSVFYYCTKLASVTIGDGLMEIPSSTFYNTALTTVTIPKNVEWIGYHAFAESDLEELILECDEVYIGGSAFRNCPLGDLEFDTNVKYIEDWAFYGTLATQVKLPESVTEITYRSFAYSPQLMSVTIPDSVTDIDTYAFEGDENLSHVLYTGTQEQWEAIGVDSQELLSATIHYSAVGNEVTTEQTCTHIKLYCSICDKWEEIEKLDPGHSMVGGKCTVCGYVSETPDANFDGKDGVTDADAIYLLRYTLFPDIYPIYIEADVNSDGTVNDSDAIYLLRHTLFPDIYPLYPNK